MTDEELRQITLPLLPPGPESLRESILYSLLGPGKRIRPRLVMAVADAIDLPRVPALRLAAALEMTHAYTLVHDDLPAMDNDDFRRGRPTNHKVYGEATAVLAGDSLALLAADALLTLASVSPETPSDRILAALRVLLETSGARGVIAGQAAETAQSAMSSLESLLEVFRLKTGALFQAALTLPLVLKNAPPAEITALAKLGDTFGIAFQIADDLEDDFAAERTNSAHIARYLTKAEARALGIEKLQRAFTGIGATDSRLRTNLLPFYEELLRKLEKA